MVPHLKRPIDILFSVLKVVSDVNVTGRLYCTKREDLKWRVVMGIIVNPFRKKLPHPQDGSSRVDVLNPRARKHWNAPPEKFETPLEYYGLLCRNDVCTIIWFCSWLSKCSRCHPLLQLTLFKALVTHEYTH